VWCGVVRICRAAGPTSRLTQICEWLGDGDYVVVFDECHKAKNCLPKETSEFAAAAAAAAAAGTHAGIAFPSVECSNQIGISFCSASAMSSTCLAMHSSQDFGESSQPHIWLPKRQTQLQST